MDVEDEVTHDLEALAPAQQAEALHMRQLWSEAEAIVADRPDLDCGDVYHALQSLEMSPAERLREGLGRVRLRPLAR